MRHYSELALTEECSDKGEHWSSFSFTNSGPKRLPHLETNEVVRDGVERLRDVEKYDRQRLACSYGSTTSILTFRKSKSVRDGAHQQQDLLASAAMTAKTGLPPRETSLCNRLQLLLN